ncbi:hypothetical protein M6B38_188285 [Iris pallida]|uniref:Uncharacterized protein n=1 Tax=Iris pallida TaxID=29817 RepID=A0AAX6EHQ6_IRIPA|nr:hypothetical protein M6B38_188285 [Iris pallida]
MITSRRHFQAASAPAPSPSTRSNSRSWQFSEASPATSSTPDRPRR